MTAFIICAVAGTLALAFSLIFDGIFDVLDLDFDLGDADGLGGGWFSMAAVSGFVAGLGFGGITGFGLNFGPILITATGLVCGLAMWYAAVMLYRLFNKLQGEPEQFDLQKVEGQLGTVQTAAKAGEKTIVNTRYLGSPRTFMAQTNEDVSIGDEVVIQRLLSADTVTIQKLPTSTPTAI